MKEALLIKYGEIALRGDNRRLYENQIINEIKRNLQAVEGIQVTKEQGRIIIELEEADVDYDLCLPCVINVLGIVGICPCIMTKDQDIGHLQELALLYMNKHYPKEDFTFKVETRRADKRYPVQSREISALIGGYILDNMSNAKVDVKKPQVVLHVELRNQAYIYAGGIKGMGGLPYASSGKGMLLLSGGIDSPVAGFMMARRGVEIIGVYYHSPPYTSERALEKVTDIAKKLTAYTGSIKLYVVPFTELQLYLHENVREDRTMILLKRAMLIVAGIIAKKEKAHCLITGDNIGQVASQTMQSIMAVNSASQLPVIRPLAGMDKQEIIELAIKIDTYPISIRPYEDCCTIFVPRHPETKPKASFIEHLESNLTEYDAMTKKAAEDAEIMTFSKQ